MNKILVFICLLLAGGVAWLIYRIVSVSSKGKPFISGKRYNTLNAGMCLAFLSASFLLIGWYIYTYELPWLPLLGSAHGQNIDRMFWVTTALTGFVFLLTQTLLFYFAFKYRHSVDRKAVYVKNNNKIEVLWTIVPFITFILLFYFSHVAWSAIRSTPKHALQIEVMAEQFNWRIRYGGKDSTIGSYSFKLIDEENDFGMDFRDSSTYDDFCPVQMHLPKGIPVTLNIRSRDVIHSVFLPNFRLKMDAVPGMPTSFSFTPTVTTAEMQEKTGNPEFNYELACAELCGRMHFAMLLIVVVDEPADFEAWYKNQQPWLREHPNYLKKSLAVQTRTIR